MRAWLQETPIGVLGVTATEAGIRTIDFNAAGAIDDGGADHRLADLLDAYFGGDLEALDRCPVDLAPQPPFRGAVLEALRKMAPGDVVSYGTLAAWAGRPGASRATGQAVGSNPLPLVIPCHRVVASGGTLGGYGGGLDTKRWLLAHEGVGPLPGGWVRRRP